MKEPSISTRVRDGATRPAAILTDLDGTLLDEGGLLGRPAREALAACMAAGIPVVPLTSKTELELRRWLTILGTGGIGAFENGAGIVTPRGCHVLPAAAPLFRLHQALAEMAASTGLRLDPADRMSRDLLARITGLDDDGVTGMLARQFDLPFVAPAGARGPELEEAVAQQPGLRLTRGGQFWHLLGAHDKEDAVEWLLESHLLKRPLAGLGDAPNDAGFLALCDVAVVVPQPGGPSAALLARLPDARVAPLPAGAGWAAAVLDLLQSSGPAAA